MVRQQKKTAADIFDAAELNGARPVEETDINGDPVPSVIQPGTEINYDRMLDLWDEFERRYPGKSPHDLQTLKHFMDYCVKGWNAVQRIDRSTSEQKKIGYTTVRQRFTDFLAAWQQRPRNKQIPHEVSSSIYRHMKTAKFRATVSTEIRVRHYLTVPYFRILMEHMWTKDWCQYGHGGTLVNDYGRQLLSIYSSSRVGEFIESRARKGSGRGLLYNHMNFVVIRNEQGEAETAICPIRDAKGMSLTPQGRPQHGMYEDMETLFACVMLPALVIALANDAFQDCHSEEEILAIPPPLAGTVHHLRIKEEMLEMPFFQRFNANGPTGQIEKAGPASTRDVKLGHRAGFPVNLTGHCKRREALVKAETNGYSEDARKQFAGHRCDIFLPGYASSISTIDGAASWWGTRPRGFMFEVFRGMSLQWSPQMEQSLPAKVTADLAQRTDFVALSEELMELGEKLKLVVEEDEIKALCDHRDEVYQRRRQLMADELQKWRKLQSRNILDTQASVMSLPSFFDRVRRLDSPRDELASLLFLQVPLRSTAGRSAIRNMIRMYQENPKVAYRPSLRPENGRCSEETCAVSMETFVIP
ncbi:hypothetical protein BJ878DRAFT_544482 [Calycina marina]|uniref:Uncharacterized protein n=1 Tax=Calycina marina TaxID=1763456 RepID=A0A9P7YYS8_9HELO|nr:hypothetical protein BJ878DRAFT_544482 [Calycina marina]